MQSRYTHGDGTPFTKEEFLQKLKTDSEFNDEFGNKGIDQISELIKQLKDNPDSRRMIVSAWAVHDLPNMTLPPCHYGFQVYTRELSFDERHLLYCKSFEGTDDNHKGSSNSEQMTEYHNKRNIPTRAISLMFNMRSVDTFLGLPFNIASYGLLLEIIAKAVNMVPDELIGNLGDTHLYLNHVDKAKEQIGRELSDEERYAWYTNTYNKNLTRSSNQFDMGEILNSNNVPTRAISLMWNQRSVDTFLGLPFNIASYGLLLEIIAKAVNMVPDELIGNLGDTHLYLNHIDQTKEQLTREPYPLPTLNINTEFWPTESGECGIGGIDAAAVFHPDNVHFYKCLLEEDIQLSNYESHPTIKAPLSN